MSESALRCSHQTFVSASENVRMHMKLPSRAVLKAGIVALATAMSLAVAGAQTPDSSSAQSIHAADPTDSVQLQREVSRLREQMRQLEQRVQASSAQSRMKKTRMSMMDDDIDDDKSMGTGMPTKGMAQGSSMSRMCAGCMNDMMGMGSMGGMNSPAAMSTPSALPGFPGQSHLYHIGATDFFLDHPEHIALSTQQQQALAKRKQQSLADQGNLQRQIDAAEQDLWQLTGADQPQVGAIEKKAREIERLRADKRVAFIRAVGDSARFLTDEQREQLTGMAPPQPANSQAPMLMPDPSQQKSSKDHM
ncbi:MAG TPA: hypothetical protein VJS12_14595 [Steroidobacteraceae bacterium]|nr:hypothetical protein [Steroidobacteraceae bacterium]